MCWTIHCCEICPKILFDFDKFTLYAGCPGGARGIILENKGGEQDRVAADNYKSKHTWWPFRPKVFLISQMWSTLPGVFLSTRFMWRIASLRLDVCGGDDEVLNRFLLRTLSLRCRDDSQTLLGGVRRAPPDRETARFALGAAGIPLRKHSGLSNFRI